MRAIVQDIAGDPLSLRVGDVPIPQPGPRDILIRVQCAAINRMDLVQAKGAYPVPAGASTILGVEVSGTVAAIGEQCTLGFQMHDKVTALAQGGGYAEFCLVDERTVLKAVDGLSMEVLASIPEAFMTAYQLCFLVGQSKRGDSVLLHAAASSVGQAAIQLLVRKGIKVFATVRGEAKRQTCESLGAVAFNVGDSCQFAEAIRVQNEGKGVNLILDPVGGTYLEENIKALEVDGKLLIYGLMGGGGVNDANFLGKIMAKRITLLSSTLRSRSVEYKEKLLYQLFNDSDGFPAIVSGEIKVDVDKTFDLEDVLAAHRYVGANSNTGKVVLLVSSNATALKAFENELTALEKRHHLK